MAVNALIDAIHVLADAVIVLSCRPEAPPSVLLTAIDSLSNAVNAVADALTQILLRENVFTF